MNIFLKNFFLLMLFLCVFQKSTNAQSNPNLVPNGGFEQSSVAPSPSTGDFNSNITWWDVAQYNGDNCTDLHGPGYHPCSSADYVSILLDNKYVQANSCTSPLYPSNKFASMISGSADMGPGYCHHSTGIRVQLIKDGQPYSLIQGHTYLLRLKLRLGGMTSLDLMNNLNIHFAKFSTNWNANPNTSTNRKWSNATSFQLDPDNYDPCAWQSFERRFVVPDGSCDGNAGCDYLQNMILYLDDNNSEEISAELSIDDVELYDEGCCIQYKQYENTSDLTEITQTSDYIRAGYDAGISGTSGNVTVLAGQNITFKAGNQIILEPGFVVQNGAVFNANIEECSSSAATGSINVPFLPNVFTPNGDGLNDNYCINVTGANQYHIQVFDSWGVLRFDYLDYIYSSWACLWDGRCNQGAPNCLSSTVPNGTYYYIITLFNCSGTVEYAGYVAIYGARYMEATSTTDVFYNNDNKLLQKSIELIVFPNPNSGLFKITITSNDQIITIKEVKVYDIMGKVILENKTPSSNILEVDITSYPKGVYYVQVTSMLGDIEISKLLKQ